MRDHDLKSAQVYTVFGGAYVSESHGGGLVSDEQNKPKRRPRLAILLLLALFGATTAATAITASTPAKTLAAQPAVHCFETARLGELR